MQKKSTVFFTAVKFLRIVVAVVVICLPPLLANTDVCVSFITASTAAVRRVFCRSVRAVTLNLQCTIFISISPVNSQRQAPILSRASSVSNIIYPSLTFFVDNFHLDQRMNCTSVAKKTCTRYVKQYINCVCDTRNNCVSRFLVEMSVGIQSLPRTK